MPHFDFITTDIDRAVTALRTGGLVGLPTETVYGLAADASNDAAVDRIFSAKGRPRGHPLILHVADLDTAERCGVFSDVAHQLAARFWPGPMTLLVPRTSSVSETVTGGRDSVGIRIPAHPVAAPRRTDSARSAPQQHSMWWPTSVVTLIQISIWSSTGAHALLVWKVRSSTPPAHRFNSCGQGP